MLMLCALFYKVTRQSFFQLKFPYYLDLLHEINSSCQSVFKHGDIATGIAVPTML